MDLTNHKFQLAVIILLLAILASVFLLGLFKDNKSIDSVAYVNLEKVFAEHPARTAAEKELNQKAANYQQQLEEKGGEISGIEQKELLNSYQAQLHNLEAELLNSVLKEAVEIIAETAAEKEVKFVLEEKDVLYGGFNLTDDVLAKIKAEW